MENSIWPNIDTITYITELTNQNDFVQARHQVLELRKQWQQLFQHKSNLEKDKSLQILIMLTEMIEASENDFLMCNQTVDNPHIMNGK